MTEKELDKLIALGEGLTIEFKESASHLSREICAMANISGGCILIGVDDQGRKRGVSQMNRMKSQVQSAARNLDPSMAADMEAVGDVLVVRVPLGPDKPYSSGGHFYFRDAATTQTMSRDEVREFFFKQGLVRWDEQPSRKFSMDRDFDTNKYRAFVKSANLPSGLRRSDVLSNLNLVTDGQVVNTATLLFAKQVSRFSLQAKLVCAVFQGTSKSKILDKQTFQDGVLQDYQAAMSYLSSRLNTEYIIQAGPRQEVLELPEEALREAVLNAIAHRDYRSTSCVQIHIFKDRVEISNPGGLVPGLKVEDLGKVSRPRNILLFSMMERMDLVETVGSGIKRIRDAMKDYGLDLPRIESGDDWFSVTFTRKPQQVSVEDTTQKTTQKRTTQKQKLTTQKTRAEILALTRRDPTVTTEQLAEHIGITRHGIRYHLNKLEQEGVIYRVGPDRGGFWEIKG